MYTAGALLIHFILMPQPLTLEHFDDVITTFKAHIDERFESVEHRLDAIDTTLADHTKRLTRIEDLLWQGERLVELERRVGKLAERTGNADLAVPLHRPLGT